MSPELIELLKRAASHKMTEAEIIEQRKSWVRGMTARCEHGAVDFETCPECLTQQLKEAK